MAKVLGYMGEGMGSSPFGGKTLIFTTCYINLVYNFGNYFKIEK